MKLDFIVIGAAKCGSSTISKLLGMHPDIFIAPYEVAFFAKDEEYAKGFAWYESLFPPEGQVSCVGEHSNHYTMKDRYPDALDRILNYVDCSSTKLIYIVRHPLEMLESFWIQMRSHDGEEVHYDFNVAVKENTDRLLDPARYWKQLQAYRAHFSDEHIHLIFLKDLKADQVGTLKRCYEFLGVNPDVANEIGAVRLNPSAGKKITSPMKSKLRSFWGYKEAVSLLPATWRQSLTEQFLMLKVDARPAWDAEVKNWAIQDLSDGTKCFLEYAHKPADWWELTPM